jgi:hypothetical protein
MPAKQSDIQTILHLIKSESEKTRKEITESIESKLDTKISGIESKLDAKFSSFESRVKKEMNKGFEIQKQELKEYLDDKFETHRRNIVDNVQTFQDAVITEIREIRIETAVNSSHRKVLDDHEIRISKVEKHVYAN